MTEIFKLRSASLIIVTLCLSQCSRDESVAAYGGADRVWTLVEAAGESTTSHATLTFPQVGQIAGQAPCNSYSATMTAPYPWFDVGPLARTKMSCPQIADEDRFLGALSGMTQSEVSGSTLILRNDTGQEMVFIASD